MEITQLDYYAALELPPSAGLRQIENAYQFAMENYAPDSLAAYGLLSDAEREEVVHFLGEARRVLCDAALRREYDRRLVAEGRYPAEAFGAAAEPTAVPAAEPAAPPAAPAPVPPPALQAAPQRTWWPFERDKPAAAPAKPADPAPAPPPPEAAPLAALDGRPIGPAELRQIREHRGLRLEEVSEKSKISLSNLRFLEEGKYGFLPAPVYVKGFLRTYARILRIDAEKLVRDYMPGYEAQHPS